MVMVDTKEPSAGYISCQNYNVNNCDQPNGIKWADQLVKYYQTPAIKTLFPFLTDFCNRTAINGVNCNEGKSSTPPANATGRCSGLPTENTVELVTATSDGSTRSAFFQSNCATFAAVPKLNKIDYLPLKLSAAGFIDPAKGNFGLNVTTNATSPSPILQKFPRFRSCAVGEIGPKPVACSTYFAMHNIPQPVSQPIAVRPSSQAAGMPASASAGLSGSVRASATVPPKQAMFANPYASTAYSQEAERELRPEFMRAARAWQHWLATKRRPLVGHRLVAFNLGEKRMG
eukprot:TRINITY_DN20033_c0_g1_i7.p1 TRINITY_DN20033_c0_g1~~TRINITY_DN20033_c0_g1_i7.p1  ORF type:complete len:288 (-),score=-11.28 TRINITY_DN20033_c0_g1_i7:258-1121(-)